MCILHYSTTTKKRLILKAKLSTKVAPGVCVIFYLGNPFSCFSALQNEELREMF